MYLVNRKYKIFIYGLKRPLFAILGITLSIIRSYGQKGEVVPVRFDQFFQNYSLIHPAASGYDYEWSINSGHRAITGVFQGVYTSYVGAEHRIKSDSLKDNFHGISVNILNDREGAFFNRGRFSFSYSRHNRLTEQWRLSMGVSAGIINYIYHGTDYYPGGASTRPNADIGLFLYNNKETRIGFTVSQLLRFNMVPLEPSLYVKRHFNFTAEKSFYITWQFSLQSALSIRYPVAGKSEISGMVVGEFHQNLSLGFLYKLKKGISLLGGIRDINLGKKSFTFFLTYYSPFASGQDLKANILEGTVRIGIN